MPTSPLKAETPLTPENPLESVVPNCISDPAYDSLAQSYGALVSRSYRNLMFWIAVLPSIVPASLIIMSVTLRLARLSVITNVPPVYTLVELALIGVVGVPRVLTFVTGAISAIVSPTILSGTGSSQVAKIRSSLIILRSIP